MDISTLARKGGKRIIALPSRLASSIIELPKVSAKLDASYRAALDQHRPRLPELSTSDHEIIEGLRTKGVYITTLDKLGIPSTAEMFSSATTLAQSYFDAERGGKLRYWDAFQASDADILRRKDVFYWGLNKRLLDIVEVYLGLSVGYDGINIFFTKADGRQVAARKWHLDVEDRRMVKMAVYLNDVDENGGPLQILHRDLPRTGAGRRTRRVMTQEVLERELGGTLRDDDVTTCVGPAGMVIFSDTASRYHRGKPAVSRSRCAIFFNYISRVPLRPFFCERGTLSRSQITKLAKDLEPNQRETLLWRRSLPFIVRMIPSAPIG